MTEHRSARTDERNALLEQNLEAVAKTVSDCEGECEEVSPHL